MPKMSDLRESIASHVTQASGELNQLAAIRSQVQEAIDAAAGAGYQGVVITYQAADDTIEGAQDEIGRCVGELNQVARFIEACEKLSNT